MNNEQRFNMTLSMLKCPGREQDWCWIQKRSLECYSLLPLVFVFVLAFVFLPSGKGGGWHYMVMVISSQLLSSVSQPTPPTINNQPLPASTINNQKPTTNPSRDDVAPTISSDGSNKTKKRVLWITFLRSWLFFFETWFWSIKFPLKEIT